MNRLVYSAIGLGTWMMEKNPRESAHALRVGLEAGANHIDTAEMYGDGKAEDIVGEAISSLREKIFVVSKVLPQNAGYKSTIQACERSLKRLKTDYLDVYLLHWRERETPLVETFRAFEKLKSDGKIRSWGVSNFDVNDMDEAVRLVGAPSQNEGRLVCNQVYYSLAQRAVESRLLPWCEKKGVTLVAYSPLGQGKMPKHPLLEKIAKETNCSVSQIMLAFLIQNENVIAIPKSSSEPHVRDNLRAMNLKLTKSQLELLHQAFPIPVRSTLPTI